MLEEFARGGRISHRWGGPMSFRFLIQPAVLALLPYIISRGLIARIARCAGIGKQSLPLDEIDQESAK